MNIRNMLVRSTHFCNMVYSHTIRCDSIFICLILLVVVAVGSDYLKKENDPEVLRSYQQERERIYKKKEHAYNLFLNSLLIDKSDDECIARIRTTNECVCTAGTFNNRLKFAASDLWTEYLHFDQPDTVLPPNPDNDSIRQSIFISEMIQKYTYFKYKELEKQQNESEAAAKETETITGQLRMTLGDSLLLDLYHEFYNDHYAEKTQRYYTILLSSDSLHLVEAWETVRNHDNNSASLLKKNYYAIDYLYDSLPDEMKVYADSLDQNRCRGIVRCSFGFFIMGLRKIYTIREVSFEEAIPQLIYMRSMKDWKCPVTIEDVWNYYNNNDNRFISPDTALVNVKIIPQLFDKSHRSAAPCLFRDTMTMASLAVNVSSFPRSIREYCSDILSRNNDFTDGWVDLDFGFYCFKKVSYKPGSTVMHFEEVKDSIHNFLCSIEKEKMRDRILSKSESKKENRSYNYFSNAFLKSLYPDDKELNALITAYKNENPTDNSEEIGSFLKIKYAHDTLRKHTIDWIKSEIDFSDLALKYSIMNH